MTSAPTERPVVPRRTAEPVRRVGGSSEAVGYMSQLLRSSFTLFERSRTACSVVRMLWAHGSFRLYPYLHPHRQHPLGRGAAVFPGGGSSSLLGVAAAVTCLGE